MTMRLLIVSTLDSDQPFGAFTRPFYLGQYLGKHFDLCQLGLNCASVDYAKSASVGSRSLLAYVRAVQKYITEFSPDIIYAQETLPGLAALIAVTLSRYKKCHLVFDFHTLSAFEYWTRLSTATNKFQEFKQFIKTYIAQGTLLFANCSIIAASAGTVQMIPKWYPIKPKKIYSVGNGVSDDLLQAPFVSTPDPYQHLRPAKIAVVIAPKTYQFPSNDMSVDMTIEVARHLQNEVEDIHFVVIGRNAEDLKSSLPANITFIGFLPSRSDFIAHLAHADICLLPFPETAVAGGARNKSLDFLAVKKLVISTPEGLRGLEEFRHQEHLLVTGYAVEEFANTVKEAVANLPKYQPLADTAYSLIQNQYSWQSMADKVNDIFNNQVK
ncbi:glycosyltransferase family 4 protein [Anabaena sp. UHCC 0187]|nr:glycosyltransferase family 4 protein [Anabaena sp. UHCC 0187]MTJ14894.1 glycosyltransferase family 4 protein [Anabaena sp. UHCC 0187]